MESRIRLENLNELLTATEDFQEQNKDASLAAFLDQVALITDSEEQSAAENRRGGADSVTLMTLHNAKGLEFSVVFMAGMEEGLFPHSRSAESEEELEEERRLCYVGITRAKERLVLTHANERQALRVPPGQPGIALRPGDPRRGDGEGRGIRIRTVHRQGTGPVELGPGRPSQTDGVARDLSLGRQRNRPATPAITRALLSSTPSSEWAPSSGWKARGTISRSSSVFPAMA